MAFPFMFEQFIQIDDDKALPRMHVDCKQTQFFSFIAHAENKTIAVSIHDVANLKQLVTTFVKLTNFVSTICQHNACSNAFVSASLTCIIRQHSTTF